MRTITKIFFSAIAFLQLLGCDKPLEYFTANDGEDILTGRSKYVITATPVGTQGVADYLLLADDLENGKITTQGNGIEQDGSYRYYVTHKNRFFSLLYGQGNPGAVTTYRLDTLGKLVKVSDFLGLNSIRGNLRGKNAIFLKFLHSNVEVIFFFCNREFLQLFLCFETSANFNNYLKQESNLKFLLSSSSQYLIINTREWKN